MPSRSPLIRSAVRLRAVATAATLTSLASMSAFAATHVQNSAAPLKPTAAKTAVITAAATPTPAPTSRSTTVGGRVATTTAAPRTKTHSS
ncbi:MAG TPA: hypothetical protein VK197_07490 [Verrucomicrobiae bacterium]|nr:hypothetical protein [Verrucomicrobiae bacterium]